MQAFSKECCMNNFKMTSVLLGGMSLLLLGACKDDATMAQAASAQTVASAKVPREVCTEETVTRQKPAKDKDRVLGTIAGAVVGGVVGDKVGGNGKGDDVATVGGAVAGGYAGNRVQKSMQKNNTETITETKCRTVYE
jgi:uncharacterized protein YcfJ